MHRYINYSVKNVKKQEKIAVFHKWRMDIELNK